jgi:hypothetical protein
MANCNWTLTGKNRHSVVIYVTSIMYFVPHKDLIGALKDIGQVEAVLWLADQIWTPNHPGNDSYS